MRVLMTGGGTAGHVNPAIAIANTIKEYDKDSEIAFVCSSLKSDKAQDLVPRAGYHKLYKVDICGRYQLWNPKNIKTLYLMIRSKGQAKKIIKEFQPDIIIGTGGFACYPLLNAGAEMGIPTVVHESNAIPGKAVKRLSGKIDLVMTNFASSDEKLPKAKRIMNVGTPNVIKTEESGRAELPEAIKKTVLSFGGSLGATVLNFAMSDVIAALADKYPDVMFYHAAGKRDYEELKADFEKKGLLDKKNVVLVDYIYDMSLRMKQADIIISRAGAMTLSELALLGKAAILVPSPTVADNHQFKNAKAIEEEGACRMVEEKDFSSGKLRLTLEELLNNNDACEKMSERIKMFARPDSNKVIYDEIKRLAEK